MSTSEIIAIVATGIVSMFGFLLRNAVNNVTDRLDSLGEKVDGLSEKFAAAAVKNDTFENEIDRIRTRVHDLSNIVMPMQGLLSRCKHCKD